MKMEDKANLPRVRIAVLGHVNVGKSGELVRCFIRFHYFACSENSSFFILKTLTNRFHFTLAALTVRYLTRRFIGEYRSNTDLLYRQTVPLDSGLLDVEIIDVSAEVENDFPIEQIQWADACLIVYSLTDRESYKYATRALANMKSLQTTTSAYLIANKADLDHLREVSESTYAFFALYFGFHRVSRKRTLLTYSKFSPYIFAYAGGKP